MGVMPAPGLRAISRMDEVHRIRFVKFVGLEIHWFWLSKANEWSDHLHLTGVDALPELSTAQTSGSPLVNTTATAGPLAGAC